MYRNAKGQERHFEGMSKAEAQTAWDDVIHLLTTKDALYQEFDAARNEYMAKNRYVDLEYKAASAEFEQFALERNAAKKEIYHFIKYVLKHREQFFESTDGEFVRINDLLRLIKERFTSDIDTMDVATSRQEILVSSFVATQCLGLQAAQKAVCNGIPMDIIELIRKSVFFKYDVFAVSARTIRRMANKSKQLQLSGHCLNTDADGWDSKFYGVKLAGCAGDIDEPELSDAGSAVEEFRSHSL